jgi:hypothetical protein
MKLTHLVIRLNNLKEKVMGKLSEIVFSQEVKKEFNIANHKVVLRELTTEDNLKMNINFEADNQSLKENIQATIEILSYSLDSVDGISPDSVEESRKFLLKMSSATLGEFFKYYQELMNPTDTAGDLVKK